jgi:hypothetical protein
MRTCINLKREKKDKKKKGFNVMKKATECLMIVTMSAVLSAGFTKNIYGDEKMTGQKKQIEKEENLKPIPIKLTPVLKQNLEFQFSDNLKEGFQNRENVSLDKFKFILEGKKYDEKILENKNNLIELGLNKNQIDKIIEIAKKHDINKKDSIDFKNVFDAKNTTHGFLAYFSIVNKNNLLNTQNLNIYENHIELNRENKFLLEMSDFMYTHSLSEDQIHKTLAGQFETPAQAPFSMRGATPTLKDTEIIELAGALTGNVIKEHIERDSSGNYLIETDKTNLNDAIEKLEADLNNREKGSEEYNNTKKDLETLKELLKRREKTFDLKMGAGTGISYYYKGLNIGLDYSILGDVKEGGASNKFQLNMGYVGRMNRFMNGFIQGGYSYDETNLYKHTVSSQGGTSFYLNSSEHLLTAYGKYSYTYGMSKEGHEAGGGLRYDYKNLFGIDVSGSNKSVGINLTGYLPITKNFGLFGEVGSNRYWNQMITGDVKGGFKFTIENFEFKLYGEGNLRFREEGGS